MLVEWLGARGVGPRRTDVHNGSPGGGGQARPQDVAQSAEVVAVIHAALSPPPSFQEFPRILPLGPPS